MELRLAATIAAAAAGEEEASATINMTYHACHVCHATGPVQARPDENSVSHESGGSKETEGAGVI